MIKKIISLLFISVLISCISNHEKDKNLTEALEKQIAANLEIAKNEQYKIESYYHENKTKYGSFYFLTKRADSLMNSFYETTKNPLLKFEQLNIEYDKTANLMLNLLDEYGNKVLNQERTQFKKNSTVFKELMLLELSRLYFNIVSYYSYAYSEGWTFPNRDITFKSEIINDGKYSTVMHSDYLKYFSNRFLNIDTVMRNGKIVTQKFNYSPNNTVFDITTDSLKNGEYKIKGYVLFGIGDKMEKQYFKHEFHIK